ncbi:DUF427 domain-containing protein [Blastococcus goldschmidtiae]|uniref:DUF427 domain-containing protein n=1 Tax=Blastococcus goldschmidtiae TaxID=3075546 RepID=A0ABU2K6T7_9ACTN|nr:DUF427 domain-containing protein [Blastococcus sp. DSM 46792]MDT0275907.1 DUF427 domain-containing protein [Blastococcus sp. DSM 46792]
MSLTKGTGPFGESPAGTFNFEPGRPEHVLYIEISPRRIRVVLAGETVADSTGVRLLHPPGRTPTYLFPQEDVRTDLFEHSDRQRTDPGMGSATYWNVRVGDRSATDAAYSWQQPPTSASAIAGLVAFDWDSMDGVFEEDEEVFVHPRDPYTRIDVLRSSRRVRVRVRDTLVADSTRPRMLLESGLSVRWYLPREDVRTDLLEPSYTTTRCPYKGVAHYWSLQVDDRLEKDVLWTYPEPFHDAEAVRGFVCFVDDRVEMTVDDASRP